MINENELKLEKEYLENVWSEIQTQKVCMEDTLEEYESDLKRQIEYSVDAYYTMDEEELSTTKTILENEELEVLKCEEALNRLKLLEKSAYFGRVDFNNETYYIGVSSLLGGKNKPLVSDWRAPVSSLFYDYELGEAEYLAPEGEINGEITKKRQYKVDRDNLIYAFDSSLMIGDEILKETLSGGATERMKSIVSTIQKEQNKIIRAPISKNLLIQGEAGSGKTSIALHRAAFLMYRRAGKLSAQDVMIISPNKMFSEYIAGVLPELGERNIIQTTFNDLVAKELHKIKILSQIKILPRQDSIAKAIEDRKFAEIVKIKNSFDFFDKLKLFLDRFSLSNFQPQDIKVGERIIKSELIKELYLNKYKSKKVSVKLGWIADYVLDELKLPKELYNRVLFVVYNMFTKKNVVEIYAEFLKEVNLKFDKKVLHFEDVPAVLYIKDYVLGLENKQSIKYLLIDEMQDYSPIHYDIINKLFDCNKLILGDINQNILNVYTRDDLVKITNQIGECNLAELTKTYRPTYEISKFCQMIKNLNYEVVDRHGKPVEILLFNNKQDELNKIMEIFKLSDKRIALICKTDEEAKEYFSLLKNVIKDISLIVEEKEQVGSKLVISSTNSKGIEFDVVIIPNVSEENYSDELDCNILYVSATRALHELYLTSTGKMSKLIDKKLDN